jgi:putative spermidine/putrescine transport system permease protein
VIRVRPRWWLLALAVWTLTPLAVLVLRAMSSAWHYPQLVPTIAPDWPTLTESGARLASALETSLALALATGIVATGLGFTIARTIARAAGAPRHLALAAALFTVIAPPLALGVGLHVAILGLGLGGTLAGVFLAHLVPATGYLTLFAIGLFSRFELSLEDEARTLGASRWQVLARVLVPLLRPRLGEGLVLGGLVSWGQLALTLLVGGGVVRTLPVELLSLVQSGNDQLGAWAALLLSVPPAVSIGVLSVGTRRTGASL